MKSDLLSEQIGFHPEEELIASIARRRLVRVRDPNNGKSESLSSNILRYLHMHKKNVII